MTQLEIIERAGLTARQRQVYELAKIQGYSVGKVARELGISKSSAYYHLKRAVEKVSRLRAEKEYIERLRDLEDRVRKLEDEFYLHIFRDHILEKSLRS